MRLMHDEAATEEWKKMVRAELRRSRRYLLSLVEDLSDADGCWLPARADGTCAKWHAGRVALTERVRWARLLPALASTPLPGEETFSLQARHDRGQVQPSWRDIQLGLARSRRLTEAVLENASSRPSLDGLMLDIVNEEYAQARFIRFLRREMGREDVAEPQGRLLQLDTDVEAPPRFHVAAWEEETEREEASPAPVSSLAEHRERRARELIDMGHRLVAAGDHRGALATFEDSAALQRTAEALTYQGWMHSMLGNVERAERLCLDAIALDPDFGNPYNDIGTLAMRRREFASAIEWFEKAKLAPRYEPRHFPYMNLGRLYAALDMKEKALEELEDALALVPDDSEIRDAIESLRRQLGLEDRA